MVVQDVNRMTSLVYEPVLISGKMYGGEEHIESKLDKLVQNRS